MPDLRDIVKRHTLISNRSSRCSAPLSGATHEPLSRQWSYGVQRCPHAAFPPMEV
jgi:hypothetical protein